MQEMQNRLEIYYLKVTQKEGITGDRIEGY